jgi:hypothetical protein
MNMTKVEQLLADGHADAQFSRGFEHGFNGSRRDPWETEIWAAFRARAGYKATASKILTSAAAQHKLGMSDIETVGLMLTPERGIMRPEFDDLRQAYGLEGAFNLCPWASTGCASACLTFSGQSGMPAAQYAQGVRTLFMLSHPGAFFYLIGWELGSLARRKGEVAFRFNTTSDIRIERILVTGMDYARAHGVHWYDYTKAPAHQRPEGAGYDLTRSASERHTEGDIRELVASGERVAVPFFYGKDEAFPETWLGMPVIDGDTSDYRPQDRKGAVLALRVKGHKGARDESGFIRNF